MDAFPFVYWSLVSAIVSFFLFSTNSKGECKLPGDPDIPVIGVQEIAQSLSRPIKMVDLGAYFLVVEQTGTIKRLAKNNYQLSPDLVVDLRDRVTRIGQVDERGLLGIALHPKFQENHLLYLNYTTQAPLRTRISEFTYDSANHRIQVSSERILLEVAQPFSNHNGGEIAFGPDGMLYISLGDGGSGNDPQRHAQNLNSLLGKILRINVNGARPYEIPADNPFVGQTGKRGEIWAYGLRNAWRFSFDQSSGLLWAADVGQDALEEINLISRGQNYGWPIWEATRCNAETNCAVAGFTPPVHTYDRRDGYSITGGFVYRGSKLPSLQGHYLFADYVSGHVWGLTHVASEQQKVSKLLSTQRNISSFAEDDSGDLYILDHAGKILKIIESQSNSENFPRKLSETGCFTDLRHLTPALGVIPYEVNAPLWSDGTEKTRYIYLPSGTKIDRTSATWNYPENTIFIKNFFLPQNNETARPIETRFMQLYKGNWRGFSYRWEGNDAVLLNDAAQDQLTMVNQDQQPETFTYNYPSRGDCLRCHNQGANFVLGFTHEQLQRPISEGSNQGEQQLLTLGQRSMFNPPFSASDLLHKPLIDYRDNEALLDDRARSMLHGNCSHCHNGVSAQGQVNMNLRYDIPLSAMQVCNTAPQRGQFGKPLSKIIKPGDPQQSILQFRFKSTVPQIRMPPLGTSRFDQQSIGLMHQWITSLEACD